MELVLVLGNSVGTFTGSIHVISRSAVERDFEAEGTTIFIPFNFAIINALLSAGHSGTPTFADPGVFAKICGMEGQEDLRFAQNEGFPLAATGTLLELAVRIQGF